MSVRYQAIGWNRQKRLYDAVLAGLVGLYVALFVGAGVLVHPNATAETLLIRAFGTGPPRGGIRRRRSSPSRGCAAQAWSAAELLRAMVEDVFGTERHVLRVTASSA
jgi:hypothetical protein